MFTDWMLPMVFTVELAIVGLAPDGGDSPVTTTVYIYIFKFDLFYIYKSAVLGPRSRDDPGGSCLSANSGSQGSTKYPLTDADVLVQCLWTEVRERAALEH